MGGQVWRQPPRSEGTAGAKRRERQRLFAMSASTRPWLIHHYGDDHGSGQGQQHARVDSRWRSCRPHMRHSRRRADAVNIDRRWAARWWWLAVPIAVAPGDLGPGDLGGTDHAPEDRQIFRCLRRVQYDDPASGAESGISWPNGEQSAAHNDRRIWHRQTGMPGQDQGDDAHSPAAGPHLRRARIEHDARSRRSTSCSRRSFPI